MGVLGKVDLGDLGQMRSSRENFLAFNGTHVGPKNLKKLSDICHKFVRKLLVAKTRHNCARNVSKICQKIVRCKIVSEVG